MTRVIANNLILTLMLLLWTSPSSAASQTDETIYVPIRAYYIFHEDLGKVSVSRDQKSIYDTLMAANQIWQQAGIRFYFAEQGFFKPPDLSQYQKNMKKDWEYSALNSLCPRTKNGLKGIDFCVIGQRESNKGPYVANFKVKSKLSGKYEKPKLGRSNVRAPLVVIPVKSGSSINPNAIRLAAYLGEVLRLKRIKDTTPAMNLMGRLPRDVYNGSNYSGIVLKPEEIKLARANAQKIAQKPEPNTTNN